MKEIKIKIDGKVYRKTDPEIRDYMALMDYNKEFEGQNMMQSKEAFLGALRLIAEWFGVGDETLVKELSLKEAFETYKEIQSNIYEVFIGVPLDEAMRQIAETRRQIRELKSSSTPSD